MRTTRLSSLFKLVLLLALIGASAFGVTKLSANNADSPASDESPDSGSGDPGPTKEEVWEGRYQAALGSIEAESRRLNEAAAAFSQAKADAPLVPKDYIVSFASPVKAESLFTAISVTDGIVLDSIFSWLSSTGVLHPITARDRVDSLGWPASEPAQIASKLKDLLLSRTDSRLSAVARAAGGQGAPSQALSSQTQEVANLRSALLLDGAMIYGIRCECSPSALEKLASAESGPGLRAVELAGLFDNPVPPANPLRDKIIETHGRYGRE